MSFSWRLLLLCALAFQAATCGQKGPLKLPPPQTASAAAAGLTAATVDAQHL